MSDGYTWSMLAKLINDPDSDIEHGVFAVVFDQEPWLRGAAIQHKNCPISFLWDCYVSCDVESELNAKIFQCLKQDRQRMKEFLKIGSEKLGHSLKDINDEVEVWLTMPEAWLKEYLNIYGIHFGASLR